MRSRATVATNFLTPNSTAMKTWTIDCFVFGCIAVAMVLWWTSLPGVDPDTLDDLGLVSILPWQYWISLFLISVGFSFSLIPTSRLYLLRPLSLVSLVLVLHATPPIIYGTLRYSWAWKHIGIVDFIQRHGAVDPTAPFLSAYHNWPGFFWISAKIANLLHLDPLQIADSARFFSVVSNLLYIVLLKLIFRRFTDDVRLTWAAIWIFLCANWVGQDYYSPQAFAYILHLLVIALCLGPLMPPGKAAQTGVSRMLWEVRAFFARGAPRPPQISPPVRIIATLAVFLCLLAIVASHQLTPLLLTFSLIALSIMTPLSVGYPVLAALSLVFWVIYPAAPFTAMYLPSEVAALGQTLGSVTDKFVDTSSVSQDVAIVAWAGRALVAGTFVLAILGWLRRLTAGGRDGVVCALLAAPLPILLVTSYGGEAVFRIYFFCLPFLSFFAASLIFVSNFASRGVASCLSFSVLAMLLAIGFLFGNNGKDRQYRFSTDEVAAAHWVYTHGGPETLLVEGARSYPSQFKNYENFTNLPIANEAPEDLREILDDPSDVLSRWFSDPAWKNGYLIITRSQKAYVEALGIMPEGALDALVQNIAVSPDFQLVFANRDARVFTASRFVETGAPDRPSE